MRVWWKKYFYIALAVAIFWFGGKYVLPVLLPFLLGGLVALAAEPAVSVGVKRLRLPRGVASAAGVLLTLTALGAIVSILAAAAVREIGNLASLMPDFTEGAATLQNWFTTLAQNAPERLRPIAQRAVNGLFNDGAAVVEQVTGRLPGVLTGVLSGVGSSALGIGTGILSAFLISARLPELGKTVKAHLPDSWYQTYLPALKKFRDGLGGWLKAQGKLMLITWIIVTAGFFLLRIPYAPGWALLVAAVDAVPILGTGTVLLPFALISLLQGRSLRAVGLLCTYGAAVITRTALEPRLVGRQLGLDPLLTLFSLYVGYRFWGFWGLLFAPILVSGAKSLFSSEEMRN